ncbi:MAG TPA: RNA methyltransferase [Acidimicrobiales bacterium]|nr:RNA methyltransferase [Acidimicrobiales bacterium]
MSRAIASANAEYQVLAALRDNRKTRNRENAFIVEGVRNIDAAFANGWSVRAALSPTAAKRSAWATSVIDRVEDHVELAPPLYEALTDREDPPELLLVVEKQSFMLSQIAITSELMITVLDRPTSPGNIGTIMRTCDALGSAAVFILGHGADPYDPRAVRASTGSFFAVPVIDVEGADELRAWGDQRVALVATDEHGTHSPEQLPSGAIALLFGNESAGLSQNLRDVADRTVAIPMQGTASSLNVAAAHAIVLFTASRRG